MGKRKSKYTFSGNALFRKKGKNETMAAYKQYLNQMRNLRTMQMRQQCIANCQKLTAKARTYIGIAERRSRREARRAAGKTVKELSAKSRLNAPKGRKKKAVIGME